MDINNLERMGRRRFMETLAGIGVGTTTLHYLDQDRLSDITYDPEEEIPYVSMLEFDEDGDRNAIYDTIDAEKHERIEAVLDAREQLLEEYELDDYSVSIKGEEYSPIDLGLQIRVPEGSEEDVERYVPTEISGIDPHGDSFDYIPVTLEGADSEGQLSNLPQQSQNACYSSFPHWGSKSGIPGGALISATGNGGEDGTIMAPFDHDEHGKGWIMSGHVAQRGGSDIAFPHTRGLSEFGEVEEIVREGSTVDNDSIRERFMDGIEPIDFAFVRPTYAEVPRPYISTPYNSDYDLSIRALLTDENIKNHVGDESWDVQRQGAVTCRKTSHITEYDPDGYAKLDHPGDEGDSGGPVFKEYSNGKAALAGIHVGGDAGILKDGIFTTVEEIENRLDGNFYG